MRLVLVAAVLLRPARGFVAAPRLPHLQGASGGVAWRCTQIGGVAVAAEVQAIIEAESAVPVEAIVEAAPKGRVRYALWAFRRSLWIWGNILGHTLKVANLRRSELRGRQLEEGRRKLAADVRDTLIRLGPTFIKIGQLMSTRVDVFPPEVLEELSRLQNEVPGFPAERALCIIREELGNSVEQLYAKFDPRPLAAASLAQVHRAVLKTGEEVVVKVQRDNLEDLFAVDLWNIKLVARLADRFDPQTESASANWKAIADTSGKVLYREADFRIEREAAETFAANFRNIPAVKIPDTYPDLSSSKVLTMEYVPGVKISDRAKLEEAGYDPVQLATQLTTSYLEQVCRHGYFHCDPHPGNLAVDNGAPGGRLIYYDFGMMEVMEPEIKKGFVDLIFSIYENLPREACDALQAMGVLRPGVDRYSIERIARDLLGTFQSTLDSADNKWENQMSAEEKKASRRARRARIGQDLFATQDDKPFLFPPKWTFVFRAFSTIDGIGKGLSPANYDLSRISQPYLRELANLRDGSTTTTAVREVGRRLGLRPVDIAEAVTQPRSVAAVARSVDRIEQGDVKLRVRALEAERQLERLEEKQTLMGAGLGAWLLLDACLRAAASPLMRLPLAVGACKLAWEAWRASARLAKIEAQARRFANEGEGKFDEDDLTVGEAK